MCKMPARRVPLVWSGPKAKVQTLTRFDPTSGRVVNTACPCGPTAPASEPVGPTFQYLKAPNAVGDPGTGNYAAVLTSPPNGVLQFSVTDKNSVDATTYLSGTLAVATTITVTSSTNPSIFAVFSRTSSTNYTTFWSFGVTLSSFFGTINVGDSVNVSST